MPRCFRYSPNGSMGRMNLPCSTVKAQTEKSTGARFASSRRASSKVSESFPPDSATATRSPLRIILKRPTASPTFLRRIFSRSKIRLYGLGSGSLGPVHWGLPREPDSAKLLPEVLMTRCLAVFAMVALFAVQALAQTSVSGTFAQTSVSATAAGANSSGMMHFCPPPFAMRPITGAPYSGEQVNETVQTLADGTHITQTMPATKVYRDSFGRTRTEREMFRGPVGFGHNVPDAPIVIEIIDPVAQSRYTLDAQNKVAHRQELGASRPEKIAATTVSAGTFAVVDSAGGFAERQVVAPSPNATGKVIDPSRPQNTTEK